MIDIFADDLDRVEVCGNGLCVRLIYVRIIGGQKEPVASIVRPIPNLRDLNLGSKFSRLLADALAGQVSASADLH